MATLTDLLRNALLAYPQGTRCWVAYSGGIDSHVLLHVAAGLRVEQPFPLSAIHINHGIHPAAEEWQQHCAHVAKALQVDFYSDTVRDIHLADKDIENRLRDARYALLTKKLTAGDILLTAHQQDDQAETVLLQLVRGVGIKGLSGMPLHKPFGESFQVRPFLSVSRAALLQYAMLHQLTWIEDSSNQDLRFARNFLRHEIMPQLSQRWPGIAATLSRSAQNCAADDAVLQQLLQVHLEACRGSQPNTLSVKGLLRQTPELQAALIRRWIEVRGFLLPSQKKLQQIMSTVLTARADRLPRVQFGMADVRRYRDDLYVMTPLLAHDASRQFQWEGHAPLVIEGVGVLQPEQLPSGVHGPFTVRFRREGDKLKNLLQAHGVPPWLRDRVMLVYQGEKLLIFAVAP